MENPTSVASRTEAVESRYKDIVRCIDSNDGTTTVSAEDVSDAWDKFKLWAGNIGARRTPDSAASLESRLKGAKRVLEQVVRLLNGIQEALDDLFEIASGKQDNRWIPSAPGLANEVLTTVQPSGCDDVGGKKVEKYEDQDLLELISGSVGSLLKITILIRKATPRDRFAKALQGSNPFMDDFDIAYVAERYPKLAGPDARWLCERLGRAITKRRQFLRYSRDHSRRIAGYEYHQTSRCPMEHYGAFSEARTRSNAPSTATRMHTNHGGSQAAHTHASTRASTLDIAKLHDVEINEAENEDTISYISTGSSFQLEKADSALHLPTLEEVSEGNEVFECPICFDIQTIPKESTWRRHAFQDLKAYTCTGQGACDSRLFGDSQSWLDHELQCHRQQWVCILCQQGPFRNKTKYEDHLTQRHGEFVAGNDQLTAFVSAGLRAVDVIPARDCPFCDEWADSVQSILLQSDPASLGDVAIAVDPKQYRRHISQHLEQLALFALPRHSDGDGNDNTNGGANLSRSTANHLEHLSPGGEQEPGEEWVPDPPLHVAAARGDFGEVKRLLDDGADIHLRGDTWGSVLDAALSYPGTHDSKLLELFRQALEDDRVDVISPIVEQSETMGSDSNLEATLSISDKASSAAENHPMTKLATPSKPADGEFGKFAFKNLVVLEKANKDVIQELKAQQMATQQRSGSHVHSMPEQRSLSNAKAYPLNSDKGNMNTEELPPPYDHGVVRPEASPTMVFPEKHENKAVTQDFDGHRHRRLFSVQSNPGCLSPQLGSPPGISTSTVEENFDYIRPADLARHDLDHDGLRSLTERREVFDKGLYHRPALDLTSTIRRGNGSQRAPSPTRSTSGFNRSNRAVAEVIYDHQPAMKPPGLDQDSSATGDLPLRELLEKPASALPGPSGFTKKDVLTPLGSDGSFGARWTKINRKLVSPEALIVGKERFEVRDDFVIVLRVLSKEEIQLYAIETVKLREKRGTEEESSYHPQCKICREIEKKQARYKKLQSDIYRWQREGNRHATSERAERDLMDLDLQLQQLEQQHYQRDHDIPRPLEADGKSSSEREFDGKTPNTDNTIHPDEHGKTQDESSPQPYTDQDTHEAPNPDLHNSPNRSPATAAPSPQGTNDDVTTIADDSCESSPEPRPANWAWTADEDALIVELRKSGMKWLVLAERLPGWSAISCRLRYMNYLEIQDED